MGVSAEESGFSGLPRSLSVWWNEETEYVLQRIERWAAYARGYNRLRSARLSPGRLTMQDEPADSNRWTISRTTNRLVVETSWAPSFGNRHHCRQVQPPRSKQQQQQQQQQQLERSPLRCCAVVQPGYRACGDSRLDNGNCLEAYSLDHSIYFKTVGEIRGRRQRETDAEGNLEDDKPSATTPIDCGDFLASDFDDLEQEEEEDEEEEEVAGAMELREQLSKRLADVDGGPAVVQLCRSVVSEDELNNNFARLGLPSASPRPFYQLQPPAGRVQ